MFGVSLLTLFIGTQLDNFSCFFLNIYKKEIGDKKNPGEMLKEHILCFLVFRFINCSDFMLSLETFEMAAWN